MRIDGQNPCRARATHILPSTITVRCIWMENFGVGLVLFSWGQRQFNLILIHIKWGMTLTMMCSMLSLMTHARCSPFADWRWWKTFAVARDHFRGALKSNYNQIGCVRWFRRDFDVEDAIVCKCKLCHHLRSILYTLYALRSPSMIRSHSESTLE